MLEVAINYLAVVVAAIVNMVLGAIWYSPAVAGKAWMAATGKSSMDVKKGSDGVAYFVSFIAALVLGYFLALLIGAMNAATLGSGAWTGFLAWLGFSVTTTVSDYLFTDRGLRLFAINNGYQLVAFVVMGAILAVWR
ncbi:MAG: DUF1761 domain-containing protein [Parcubacteria group bacterium]|nr:DUF1761 domain-containing protein [Parcubacteria group bacterium]